MIMAIDEKDGKTVSCLLIQEISITFSALLLLLKKQYN